MKLPVIAATTLAFAMSGCVVPYNYTMQQGASGLVVDRDSRAPLSGASVTVNTSRGEVSATTGADGSFLIPGITKWGVYIVPMDPGPVPWALTVRSKGYVDYSRNEITTAMQRSVRDVGEIGLEKNDLRAGP